MTTADAADPLVHDVYLEARPETVFDFFVDARKLERWLAVEATVDPRPGGACVQVRAGDGRPDADLFHMEGEFVEVDPPKRVVFTWGFIEPSVNVPVGSSTVEVTFTPEGSGTRVQLIHRDLPRSEVASHEGGWAGMLDRLARAVGEAADSRA